MSTNRRVSDLSFFKIFPTKKLSLLLCGAILLSGCAGNNIVKVEPSVKQLHDLNDLDRDGVIEAREKCANTVLGATIDNYGCGKVSTYIVPQWIAPPQLVTMVWLMKMKIFEFVW